MKTWATGASVAEHSLTARSRLLASTSLRIFSRKARAFTLLFTRKKYSLSAIIENTMIEVQRLKYMRVPPSSRNFANPCISSSAGRLVRYAIPDAGLREKQLLFTGSFAVVGVSYRQAPACQARGM